MSTTSSLLLLDDERKAQLDLLNRIDEAGSTSTIQSLCTCCSMNDPLFSILAAVNICTAASEYLATGINAKSIAAAASE